MRLRLIKRIFHYDELLSKETKDNILKHKRRIQYFFIVIPSMLSFLGYLINSIKTKNYVDFKLFYLFLKNFVNNVLLNIGPISMISILIAIWLITMYKPNIVKMFWITFITLLAFYILLPDFDLYIIEILYHLYLLFNTYKEIITGLLAIILITSLMITKVRKAFINGLEILIITSMIYLEIIGEYELLFFIKNFTKIFKNSMNLLNDVWGITVTVFIVSIFLSMYNKKIMSIIFFLTNKYKRKRLLKNVIRHPNKYPNMEIVKISEKVKMPLLKYKDLPEIGVVVPAYNESDIIGDTIESLLNADYEKDKLSIIIVSDGSTDDIVEMLKYKYRMRRKYIKQSTNFIKHNESKLIYQSIIYKNLILIDKNNGGKSDALNLGLEYLPINVKYMSVIDADSIVDKYSFRILATQAEQDNKVVALAGTILPKKENYKNIKTSILNNIQLFDYLSSFHGERGALSLLNAVLIIPGAFGFFNKWALLELEGYPQDVLAEDGILTIRLHEKKHAKIKLVPEAISYTQVPSTLADLRKQRIRWFKGLTELLSLFKNTWKSNKKLSLVFLDYFIIEWVTPIMAPIGIFILISNPKMVTYSIFYIFMSLAIITPIIQGILCLLMEASYRKIKITKLVYLPLSILLSPLIILWRNDALLDLKNKNWGFIKRY